MIKILKFINSNDFLLVFIITFVHVGTMVFTFHHILYHAWLNLGARHIYDLTHWVGCITWSFFFSILIIYFCSGKTSWLQNKVARYFVNIILVLFTVNIIYVINTIARTILVFDSDWHLYPFLLWTSIKNYTLLNIFLFYSSWLFYSQIKLFLKNWLGETEIIPQLSSDEKIYFIALKLGQEYVIELESINLIVADGNYMNLHVDEGIFPIRITLEQLERKLKTSSFYKINRSTIINVRFIKKLDAKREKVLLKNNQFYPISRSRRNFFKKNLNKVSSTNFDESHPT